MGNQEDAYDQWAQKQEAMGRRVSTPIVPIPEFYCTDAAVDHHTPTRDLDA